jgi:glucose/arabinose dehydrogenase
MSQASRIPIRLLIPFAAGALLCAGPAAAAVDSDVDGIDDLVDNCMSVANPDQRDTDGDAFGNACDADLDGNLVVDARDLARIKKAFFTADPDADLNGDGVVNFDDLKLAQAADGPGPSAPAASIMALNVQRVFPQLEFDLPVGLLQAPGDASRWFVLEQRGVVKTFPNVPNPPAATVMLDISDRVECCGEAGLLGLAFHPDFPNTPRAFVSYTRDGPNPNIALISFISEFRTTDGGQTLDPDTERPILVLPQPYSNHNGGHVAFGPDGYLYIGFGDGGSSGDPQDHAQNVNDLLGSLLRIDINVPPPRRYTIPPDNPFAGNPGCQGTSGCPEIYAWGLRNPWRWSFDTATGRLWLGDVGQSSFEEINIIENGGNYGWRCYEGFEEFNTNGCGPPENYDFPVTAYGRSFGFAVTGGYVYHGNRIPPLRNFYVYGDYGSGRIWLITPNLQPIQQPVLDTPLAISSFGQGADGEVYLVDYDGGLYRLVFRP